MKGGSGSGSKKGEIVVRKVEGVKKKKEEVFDEEDGGGVGSFEGLGIGDEVMGAVREMGIEVPTEIQCIGVPAVLDGKSVVLGSHTGSGKTLAYLLPLVQVMGMVLVYEARTLIRVPCLVSDTETTPTLIITLNYVIFSNY